MTEIVYSVGPEGRRDPAGFAGEPFGPNADRYPTPGCCGYSACWCYDGVNDQ